MFPKLLQNDKHFSWTNHIKNKMLFYGLSEQRIRTVFKSPDRREEGIVEYTVAAMQKAKTRKNPEEVWIMYAHADKLKPTNHFAITGKTGKIIMISAWRYPGVTKPGATIFVPEDTLTELRTLL
ncbi:MAG: hypothetical protein COU08_03270 [Candidatus Harrisonbacteria bacterium CG10_big_fil_rev_8_21_14_0_10_42_17]|uniref:Uncharacterized protein n=1 Tax=Candidatus Harrisonbacteria bacterium CG10_big_fil_rev_8_21_14_0_10_42_17 TaxID=1974584 RepID=A0A2M6WHP2_9BACT|nr:MAG: hypothetical protein COU08_03270 [Candidatus Harrisonbacteria bacterium CG10_big_fil_rev_8_21_14_0_10_42_17]